MTFQFGNCCAVKGGKSRMSLPEVRRGLHLITNYQFPHLYSKWNNTIYLTKMFDSKTCRASYIPNNLLITLQISRQAASPSPMWDQSPGPAVFLDCVNISCLLLLMWTDGQTRSQTEKPQGGSPSSTHWGKGCSWATPCLPLPLLCYLKQAGRWAISFSYIRLPISFQVKVTPE